MFARITTTTFLLIACAASELPAASESPLDRLAALVADSVDDLSSDRAAEVARLAVEVEAWAAAMSDGFADASPAEIIATNRKLLELKASVDRLLDKVLGLRGRLHLYEPAASRQEKAKALLLTTSRLIDLSGRLRYLLRDVVDQSTYAVEADLAAFDQYVDLLTEYRSSIGAAVVSYVLFDPLAGENTAPLPEAIKFPDAIKLKVLKLMAAANQADLLPDLAAYVRQPGQTAALTLIAANVIWQIGLPQDERPGSDPTLPKPVITANELGDIVGGLRITELNRVARVKRRELLTELRQRRDRGANGALFRCNGFDIREGDWLLMRNPSPYNLFSDLSPGLFTHVGVVAAETGVDGIRRFVIVDLPEKGRHIPATNVDLFLQRTLHYTFLRHEDPAVGRKMADVARQVIGNPCRFDLNFRTQRVIQEKGQPLSGREIHTYCAGFLILCAQETGVPLEQFFALPEQAAGGKCAANLQKLGLSIGDDFVSPTGALFSPRLQIVGQREPMYSPAREISESVFDHFAHCMIHQDLRPSPTAYQRLRETLARMSKDNPLLARALAAANDVSEATDLETAAKAAAVVESLDEIAFGSRDEFLSARRALMTPVSAPPDADAKQSEALERFRQRHDALYQKWLAGTVTPRQLRIELVEYYSREGRSQLEQRFFSEAR